MSTDHDVLRPPADGADVPPAQAGKRRAPVRWLLIGALIAAVAAGGYLLGAQRAPSGGSAQPAPTAPAAPEPDRDGDGTPDRWDGEPDDPTWNAGAPRPAPAVTAAAVSADPADYAAVGDRDWALIAKDPDSHIGERIVVYAEVSQFDSATGTGSFRGYAAASDQQYWAVDGTNTVFTGDEKILAPVVQGDVVKVYATVLGSLSYDTQIGGSTTVPSLAVGLIEVIRQGD